MFLYHLRAEMKIKRKDLFQLTIWQSSHFWFLIAQLWSTTEQSSLKTLNTAYNSDYHENKVVELLPVPKMRAVSYNN